MRIVAVAALAALAANSATASMVFFKNLCDHQIDLYDNNAVVPMPPNGETSRNLPLGYHGMFRNGVNPQATLAEFAFDDKGSWFDISIIPTGNGIGPGYCKSIQACKEVTKGVGFNTAMQIAPRSNFNDRCRTVTCMADECEEAYKFPEDDIHTHHCAPYTDFDVIFCPGGTGGVTPAPTTPAPTVETRSMDSLLESGLLDGSGSGTQPNVTTTPEPTTTAPPPPATVAPVEIATPVGTEAPAVEANTQSSSGGSTVTGTVFLLIGAVAAVGGIVMIVVIRRKKAALDAMEDKDSLSLTTPSNVL